MILWWCYFLFCILRVTILFAIYKSLSQPATSSKLSPIISSTMKYTVAALLAALATTCLAQSVNIVSPASDTNIFPGRVFEVVLRYSRNLVVSLYTARFFTKPHWSWFYRTLIFLLTYWFALRVALWLAGRIQLAMILIHIYSIWIKLHSTMTLHRNHPHHRRPQTWPRWNFSTPLFPLSTARSWMPVTPYWHNFASLTSLGFRQW